MLYLLGARLTLLPVEGLVALSSSTALLISSIASSCSCCICFMVSFGIGIVFPSLSNSSKPYYIIPSRGWYWSQAGSSGFTCLFLRRHQLSSWL